MDILYVVGNGSAWNNNELRYSLRSLDKNGINVGRIFIATTQLPSFINPEAVTHFAIRDLGQIKHINIMNKVESVMRYSDIADDFLLSSDDHFYIKPTDFDHYPLYHKGEIQERPNPQEYWVSMRDTKRFLTEHGLTTLSTNPHCNTHFNRPLYIKHIALMDAGKKLRYGAEVNCLMGNLMIAQGIEPVQYEDVKINKFKNREDLLRQLGDTHCFSIYDGALKCGIKEYLRELFPNKSRWEK